jgi:hypothetical protein
MLQVVKVLFEELYFNFEGLSECPQELAQEFRGKKIIAYCMVELNLSVI